MAQNGLLGYTLPAFGFRQWEHLSSQAVGALSPKEIEQTYAVHAALRAIGDMYAKLVTIPPEEMKDYTSGGSSMSHFWYNYFAGNRVGLFERLQQAVRRVLDTGNPVQL